MTTWQDEHRLHTSVLVSPRREKRRDRKLRKASARALLAEDRDARRTIAKQKADDLAAERRSTVVLPEPASPARPRCVRGGDCDSPAIRTPRRLSPARIR